MGALLKGILDFVDSINGEKQRIAGALNGIVFLATIVVSSFGVSSPFLQQVINFIATLSGGLGAVGLTHAGYKAIVAKGVTKTPQPVA